MAQPPPCRAGLRGGGLLITGVGPQTLGKPVQVKPGSTVQWSEHPSPFSMSPSSQTSPGSCLPLPQVELHWLGWPLQTKPGSIKQLAEQPSPLTMLLSSHCSPA